METALDALPGRPLAAEDVAALNDAATIRVIPYVWFGEQVVAALLLHDERPDGDDEEVGADAAVTDTDPGDDEGEGSEDTPFGGRDEAIGTVEVIEDEAGTGPASEAARERADEDTGEPEDGDGDLSVFAVGYDDAASAWIAICEIDPDGDFADAEAPIREWIESAYHETLVDRMAIGPSEFEFGEGN